MTYNFYNTASPVYGVTTPISTQAVALSDGLVPDSAVTPALAAGSYRSSACIAAMPTMRVRGRGGTALGQSGFVEREHGDLCRRRLRYRRAGRRSTTRPAVTGAPFAPTGTVTYNFYNTASPVYGVTTPISTQTVTLSAAPHRHGPGRAARARTPAQADHRGRIGLCAPLGLRALSRDLRRGRRLFYGRYRPFRRPRRRRRASLAVPSRPRGHHHHPQDPARAARRHDPDRRRGARQEDQFGDLPRPAGRSADACDRRQGGRLRRGADPGIPELCAAVVANAKALAATIAASGMRSSRAAPTIT